MLLWKKIQGKRDIHASLAVLTALLADEGQVDLEPLVRKR